jgi:hypothetical protein
MNIESIDAKEPKDLRYRRQFFPDADSLVFDTRAKGFIPLPIILRKLIRHLTSPELRVLIYLQLRASKYGICYPTNEEIVHELGLTSKKNLLPHIESLEKQCFISTASSGSKRFFLIHDPRVPIGYFVSINKIDERELFEIDDLLKDLGQPPIERGTQARASSPPGLTPDFPSVTTGQGPG